MQKANTRYPLKHLIQHYRGAVLPVLLPTRVAPTAETTLAIVAIMKNEGPYLREWVLFHKLAGIDRFYLYDNASTDESAEVLKPFVEDGSVTVVPWGNFLIGFNTQRLAYAHAVANFGGAVKWMIFIDIDEFIFSETQCDLHDSFTGLPDCAALQIPRFEFGTNGHKTKPDGLVIENYTRRSSSMKTVYKSAARPACVTEARTHHQIVDGGTHTIPAVEGSSRVLRVNHYCSKSEAELKEKMQRRWPMNSTQSLDKKAARLICTNADTVSDEKILPIAEKLKIMAEM